MKFKHHPIVKDLQVNEDGSQMFYQGRELSIKEYKSDRNNYPVHLVNFNSQTHGVTKIVCEVWNGLKPDQDMVVKRRDLNPNNQHYSNLYWGNRGGMRTKKTRRSKLSKVSIEDIGVIMERIEAGETLHCIATDYNTTDMSIYRIKKHFLTDKKSVFKEAVKHAKDGYEKHFAFATYKGFKSVSDAIKAFGRYQFLQLYKKELSW